jgi:hypothetical protein
VIPGFGFPNTSVGEMGVLLEQGQPRGLLPQGQNSAFINSSTDHKVP